MFRIAICDDDAMVCSYIERIILRQEPNEKIDIEVFYSGKELCDFIERGYEYELIFLDIEMKEINGIETAKIIREEYQNERTQFIYISSKQHYAMELFETRPLNFLIKPLSEEKVIYNLKKAMNLTQKINLFFEFRLGKTLYKLKLNSILYFESNNKKISLITKDGIYEYYGKLSDAMKQLPKDDFLSIHKSYIVNYFFVKEVQYETITLSNGKKFPISQPYRKNVRETLMNRRKEI